MTDTTDARRERYAAALYATLEVTPHRHPWATLSAFRRSVWYARAEAAMAVADAETAEQPPEDPQRIDRLRPEFFDHASVQSIDAQVRRAKRQRGMWDGRLLRLTELRSTRLAQIDAGTWPASEDGTTR
jgi:hypothetical protein